VGDEDLLEIIGNSKNLPRLQKHLKKMFAGVTNILLDDDNNQVLGIGSKEGEEVRCCQFSSVYRRRLHKCELLLLFPATCSTTHTITTLIVVIMRQRLWHQLMIKGVVKS